MPDGDILYTFLTDKGTTVLPHAEYLKNAELRRWVNDPKMEGVERLYLGRTILAYSDTRLKEDRVLASKFEYLKAQQFENPLQFFAPNCREHEDFINDDEHDVCAIRDPHRVGKTTLAFIKGLVNVPTIPCDPAWPIFQKHGVTYKPYKKPVRGGIATYDTRALSSVVWREMVRRWLPDAMLGPYARTRGKRSQPDMAHTYGLELPCGSYLSWLTYEMDPGTFEVSVFDWILWDEQGRRAMFNGVDRGMRTTRGRHFFSLTPYKLKGRPDTGAGSWLEALLEGRQTMGHKVKTHTSGSIRKTPDWIYPEEEKDKEFYKWEIEPSMCVPPNEKMLAEGRARLHGEWHYFADLVLDNWNPKVHWITPLWTDHPPLDHTLYRAIDHGGKNPTVCLYIAVSPPNPESIVYIYDAYYSTGKMVDENVAKIIEKRGNTRVRVREHLNQSAGMTLTEWEEQCTSEVFQCTVMDSRSFATDPGQTGSAYGELYRFGGLRRLVPASGKRKEQWIPMVQSLLAPRSGLIHPITKQPGGAQLYVFASTSCTALKHEIEGWVYEQGRDAELANASEKPREKDDHGPCALGYAVQIPLKWVKGSQTMWRPGASQPERVPPNSLVALNKRAAQKKGAHSLRGGYRPL